MPERSPGPLARYGAAVLAVALATGARLLLDPALGHQYPYATLFFAVLAAALHGGFGPAVVAVVLGAVLSVLFLLPPHTFGPEGWDQRVGLGLFFLIGGGIAALGGSAHESRLRTERVVATAHARGELLRATLLGIGDAVIVTDAEGRVTFLNPVAEALTGWTSQDAAGRTLTEVFRIVREGTREAVENPAARAVREGRVVGLANHTILISRDGTERPIDDSAAPIRSESGRVTGAVLVFRDITERRRLLDELQAERQRLRAVVDNVPAGIFLAEAPSGRIVLFNRRVEEILRHPVVESQTVSEYDYWVAYHPDGRRVEPEEWPLVRAIRGEVRRGDEYLYQRGDGTRGWIRVSGAPIRDASGALVGGVVAFYDIDPERQMEERLRRSEARFAALIDHAPAAIFVKDREGRYELVNRVFEQLAGLDRARIVGRTDEVIFPAETAARFQAADRRVIESGQPELFEESFEHLIQPYIFLTTKFALPDANGGRVLCGIATDVTERRRAEERVRADEERLALALAAARLGDWSWDAETDVVTFSPRAAEVFGIPPGPRMTWTAMQELLHPDDRDRARLEVERSVADGRRYDIEYRVRRPSGGEVWVSALGRAQYGLGARPAGMFGVVQDITARKRAEEELRDEKRTVETLNAIGTRLVEFQSVACVSG